MPASYETKVKSAAIVKQKCKEYGLDEHQTKEVLKIVEQESGFDPSAKNRTSSASGLGQFITGGKNPTWKEFGNGKDVFDAEANADATVRYYKKCRETAIKRGHTGDDMDAWVYKYYHDGYPSSDDDKTGYNSYKNVNQKDGIPDLSISPKIKSSKKKVTTATTTRSPIALDLDGDGVETTALADVAHFDHDANGFAEQTGWVSSDDGLLVMDRDGNGNIDSGKELFGDQTILSNGTKASNGFQALFELDDNKDGKIDANDAAYTQLKVWQDIDGDGYSSSDELLSLSDAGVASINTGYTSTEQTDPNGNTIKQTGSFTKSDGTTGNTADVYFQVDKTDTIANERLDVPEDIASLPDLEGYGNVYDLQQAMVRDTSGALKGLVEQFAAETDAEARRALIIPILYKWAGVENIDPLSRAARIIYGNAIGDARKLATLEAFMGEGYVGTWCWGERDPNPHGPASKILLRAFDELAGGIYSQLMAQTHFKPLFDSISVTWNDETNQVEWDVSATGEALQALYITNPDNAPLAMSEFADIFELAGDAGVQALEDLRLQGDPTGDGFLQLLAIIGMNTTVGNASNNTLQGSGNDDIKRQAEGYRHPPEAEAIGDNIFKLAA